MVVVKTRRDRNPGGIKKAGAHPVWRSLKEISEDC